jgi:hypothetical protein
VAILFPLPRSSLLQDLIELKADSPAAKLDETLRKQLDKVQVSQSSSRFWPLLFAAVLSNRASAPRHYSSSLRMPRHRRCSLATPHRRANLNHCLRCSCFPLLQSERMGGDVVKRAVRSYIAVMIKVGIRFSLPLESSSCLLTLLSVLQLAPRCLCISLCGSPYPIALRPFTFHTHPRCSDPLCFFLEFELFVLKSLFRNCAAPGPGAEGSLLCRGHRAQGNSQHGLCSVARAVFAKA